MLRSLMPWLLNVLYAALLTLLSPVILWRMLRHGRYRRGIQQKLFGRLPVTPDGRPVAWFHAVSVGEIVQLQKIVDEFRRQTGNTWMVVVSTSTDTGYDLASQRFPGCQLVWFPLDFSWAVRTALQTLKPRLLVLVELELWPGLLLECSRQQVPVAIVNARLSERSFRRYLRGTWFLQPIFSSPRSLSHVPNACNDLACPLIASTSQDLSSSTVSPAVLSTRQRSCSGNSSRLTLKPPYSWPAVLRRRKNAGSSKPGSSSVACIPHCS
jgi:hypothetical protein